MKTKKRARKKPTPAQKALRGLVNYRHPDAFGKLLGYRVMRVSPARRTAEIRLKIRYDHLSPAGRVHGGVISAFFDIACAVALFPLIDPKGYCSTVELKVNYLRPIDLGDELVAKTQVVFLGKKLSVIHGYIWRKGHREPVAMATGTYNIVTPALRPAKNAQ